MAYDKKIDSALQLIINMDEEDKEKIKNLQAGFNDETKKWEVIVKYNGDLNIIGKELGAEVEILTQGYGILTLEENKITQLINYPQIEYIERPKRLELFLDNSLRESCITSVNRPPYNLKGEGVLLGIIDSGIDYSHPDFIKEDGSSRILYIWDQTLEGNPPEGFAEGVEFTKEDIDEALKLPTLVERIAKVPHRDLIGHGTHVAGIAGGNGRGSRGKYIGVAPEAEYIIVKLGRKGTNSFPRTTELMRAVKYVVEKGEELKRPIAINISFGTNEGSHDGNSIVETYMDEMANRWKTNIIVATGNEGDTGHHVGGILKEGEEKSIQFIVDKGKRELALTLWKSFVDTIKFSITSPSGESTGLISSKEGIQINNLGNTEIVSYFGSPSPLNGDEEIFIVLNSNEQFIDNGIWELILYGENIVEGIYDIWMPITEEIGRDTVFLEPTLEHTITIPATAERMISIGAYNGTTNQIAPFSGRGYTRRNRFIKPDLVAPGVNITAPFIGGGYETLSGTSMAAPHVTGAVALLMEWGIVKGNAPFLYGEKLKSYLRKGARRNRPFLNYPQFSWGYGSLCLANVFNDLRGENSMEESLKRQEANETMLNKEAIISEEYFDYIVEYEGNIEKAAIRNGAANVFIINENNAILQIPKGIEKEFFKNTEEVVQYSTPLLFGHYGRESLEASDILVFHNYPYGELRGNGVLVGVIDSGIDYTHPAFMYEDNTTRILSIWDQTLEGNSPEGFGYGVEFTEEDINKALKSENPREIVPHVDSVGHGTFLTGVAAGYDRENKEFIGAAPDSELLVVKLKPAKKYLRDYNLIGEEDTSVYQSTDVITALKYMVEKAKALGKPIVISLGIGSNEGGHDGTSFVESYMAELGGRRGVVMITSAGNEANKAHHTSGILANGQTEDIEIRVAERETGFILSIWNNAPDRMSISIISPTGEFIERIPARFGEQEEINFILEKTKVKVDYIYPEARTGDQLTKLRFENPTEGNWIITLHGDFIVDGRYHVWLPREGWIDKETVFLRAVPETTVTVPGTGEGTITVGAYDYIDNSLYTASGRGSTRDDEIKPDLVAPGVNVEGPLPGGRYGKMTGTSVAAAITAGAAALLLEWGIIKENDPTLTTRKVRTYLIRGANRREPIVYPNKTWGYGELNLLNAFQFIRKK
ncbi:S8 family peptidase [Defluviitalea phaphyphila]|uniref:S8 family peptidase n=1 Tax=Defluviitalea phaphyphila TaxID=1473580 RepID=UPI00073018B3|nr:S8 family peptidase [Defluviitalea phaphyphila]